MEPEEIRRKREEAGWTRQTFAELVGAPTSAVYKWEKGTSKPSPRNRKRLEEVFSGSTNSGAGNDSEEVQHLRQRIVDLEGRLADKEKNIALLEEALSIAKSTLVEISNRNKG